jgi:hypothetical protein
MNTDSHGPSLERKLPVVPSAISTAFSFAPPVEYITVSY